MNTETKETKKIPYKIYLEEHEMPTQYYNVRADMKKKPAPLLNPGTLQPMTFEELRGVFCDELVKQELDDTQGKIEVLEERLPQAMSGSYPLTLEELTALIRKQKEKREEQHEEIMEKEAELKNITDSVHDREERKQETPTWKEIFLHGDSAVKRVLVNQLIERIDVTREEVVICFKINMELFVQNRISYMEKPDSKSSDSEPRKTGDSGVPE